MSDTNANIRKRRYRERRRAGIVVTRLEVPQGLVDALMDAGWLEEWDERDRPAIARAVVRVLENRLGYIGPDADRTL